MYSLPGKEDPIRKKLYRSFRHQPSDSERREGSKELTATLARFSYKAGRLPEQISVSTELAAVDYFRQFPGLDAGSKYNNAGFWELPIPVSKALEVDARDVVIYDPEGYPALKEFLKKQGIRHISRRRLITLRDGDEIVPLQIPLPAGPLIGRTGSQKRVEPGNSASQLRLGAGRVGAGHGAKVFCGRAGRFTEGLTLLSKKS